MLTGCKSCLVIAAHADDETLGAGGTIARLSRAGCRVTVAIATDSTSAQYQNDAAAMRRRRAQTNNALEILGVHQHIQGDFPDMRLDQVPHVELNQWVASCIALSEADMVLVHHPADVNLDHQRLFASTLVATRPTPGHGVRTVLSYFVNSATEWGLLNPSATARFVVFSDIASTLHVKLRALGAYDDEVREAPHPRSIEAVEAFCRSSGAVAGLHAAEPFEVVRMIWGSMRCES